MPKEVNKTGRIVRPPHPGQGAASTNAAMDEVSKTAAQQKAIKQAPRAALEIYYDGASKEYFLPEQRGHYMKNTATALRETLNVKCGLSKSGTEGGGPSPIDAEMVRIREEHCIDAHGALAGFTKGLKTFAGVKFLVRSEAKLIEPAEGNWSLIRSIIEPRFQLPGCDQLPYLYGIFKRRLEALYNHQRMASQALIIAGQANSGKSFMVDHILTPLLGGRSANPYKSLSGDTNFTGGESAAENLVIDDAPAKIDERARGYFGQAIKERLMSGNVRVEPKFCESFNAPLVQFLTILVNDAPTALRMVPTLEEGTGDKLTLLKCAPCIPMPMPTGDFAEQEAFRNAVLAELPAFAYFLRNIFQVPSDLADGRYGVRTFHNEELSEALNELSGWRRFLEILRLAVGSGGDGKEGWEMSASEWVDHLTTPELTGVSTSARLLLRSSYTCGALFAEAQTHEREQIAKRVRNGVTLWKYTPRPLHQLQH